MGHDLENPLTFLTRLGRKQRPTPTPQTSLIFELPNELILSILSYISPEPQLTGHYARFRTQYFMEITSGHHRRTHFLRPLSMTCKAMRFRLRPWIWERVEDFGGHLIYKFSYVDKSLATSVKFLAMGLPWYSVVRGFVKCLQSLPNLHTLELGHGDSWPDGAYQLEVALKYIELPQIKTLILLPVAHPLLKACRNVEDVVWVVDGIRPITSTKFLQSLASIRGSKIKRLAIPLISEGNISRSVAACPRLTELTILLHYPRPHSRQPACKWHVAPTGVPPHLEIPRSVISELVNTCKALQDFCTLQIVHFTLPTNSLRCYCGSMGTYSTWPHAEAWNRSLREHVEGVKTHAIGCLKTMRTGRQQGEGRRKTVLRDQVNGVKDWAADRLKKPKTGHHGREGRMGTTLKVIELNSVYSDSRLRLLSLGSVKVKEYEV